MSDTGKFPERPGPMGQPTGENRVADAPAGNWVDVRAPLWARPYLRLSRADRPIGTWLLVIPCFWGIALAALGEGFNKGDLWLILSCGLGAFLMRGAGCTWNDYSDRDIDALVARTRSRPLPAGHVTPRAALVWMGAQAMIAAVILFSYNWLAISLGILSLALVAVYPYAKRFTWWPQVFLGLAFNWGALVLYAAHAGHLSAGAFALYAAGIAWTLYYDTIYALQDVEDDAMAGVKSTARLFGVQSRRWLWGFLAATLGFLTLAIVITAMDSAMAPIVGLLGVAAMGWHLVGQMHRLDTTNPASCLTAFRTNRDSGLIFGLFLALAAIL
jgi:4-hydroxybenzoate polyprenyltransferase